MSRRVGLDFACNDPDNGLFAGRIEGIQLYATDAVFELEPKSTRAPMITHLNEGEIRVAGKRWKIVGSKDWVGNWCWNRYVFPIERAADFLIWLNGRQLFNLTCGDSRLYDAWRHPRGLSAFRPLLVTLLIEATA